MEEARRFILLSLAALFLSGAHSTTFTFKNSCPYTVWPGMLTGAGKPQLSSTGFQLSSGASSEPLTAPPQWSGRLWGRTGCSTDPAGKFTCATGDCGSGQVSCNGAGAIPPATLMELTLDGDGGQDFYDVSLVDGFNLPASLSPQGGTGGCSATSCPADVNSACPEELGLKAASGGVVGCKSACLALNRPEFCCTGSYGTAATCPPTKYSEVFKRLCPQAYSYAYDDKTSTFTCKGGPNYLVTFCP